MTTTVIKIRKFDKNFNKKILKNPEKGQLLSDGRRTPDDGKNTLED